MLAPIGVMLFYIILGLIIQFTRAGMTIQKIYAYFEKILTNFFSEWTTNDFALFDLVEEVGVNVNFYDLLNVKQVRKHFDRIPFIQHNVRFYAKRCYHVFRVLQSDFHYSFWLPI